MADLMILYRNILFSCVTLMALLSAGKFCPAAPEPAIVQPLGNWTLDVLFEQPRQIVLKSDRQAPLKRFWYTIITVTNNQDIAVDFYPQFELVTDTFQAISAGDGVPISVFEHVKKRHQGRYPFLEYWEKTSNKVLKGSDNTKDIAIIWPDFDTNAKGVQLFISGLSDETVAIEHPVEKDNAGRAARVMLRKTLELSYTLSGDPAFRSDTSLAYADRRWVMR
ncbi:MAG: hypothetical protein JXB29_00450 [Sedimentisphaerales bacterium]|nr:hypothetical protein [Sedimentisphaerales bacterium]